MRGFAKSGARRTVKGAIYSYSRAGFITTRNSWVCPKSQNEGKRVALHANFGQAPDLGFLAFSGFSTGLANQAGYHRQQILLVNGLLQICLGPQIQCPLFMFSGVTGRHDHNGDAAQVSRRAKLLHGTEAIARLQPYVQQNDVGTVTMRFPKARQRVFRKVRLIIP